MGLRRTFTGTSFFQKPNQWGFNEQKVQAGNLSSHFGGNTRLREIENMEPWENMINMFKHPGEVVLSTCAPGFIDSSSKTKASEIIDTHGSHMSVCARLLSCMRCHVVHVTYMHCVYILATHGEFLKWWYPKSPWVSILKWSNFGWLGVPLFLEPPTYLQHISTGKNMKEPREQTDQARILGASSLHWKWFGSFYSKINDTASIDL